jgi:hypothetical protein
MVRSLRTFTAVLVLAATLVAPVGPAGATAISGGQVEDHTVPVVLDALILRPLGLVATAAGSVLFLVAAPIVAITRPTDIRKPFNTLVMLPARFTFVDPLGHHPDRVQAEYAGKTE